MAFSQGSSPQGDRKRLEASLALGLSLQPVLFLKSFTGTQPCLFIHTLSTLLWSSISRAEQLGQRPDGRTAAHTARGCSYPAPSRSVWPLTKGVGGAEEGPRMAGWARALADPRRPPDCRGEYFSILCEPPYFGASRSQQLGLRGGVRRMVLLQQAGCGRTGALAPADEV